MAVAEDVSAVHEECDCHISCCHFIYMHLPRGVLVLLDRGCFQYSYHAHENRLTIEEGRTVT